MPALFVRNIDLPEAVIFYDVFGQHGHTDGTRGGAEDWRPLLRQCDECGTAAIVLYSSSGGGDSRRQNCLDIVALVVQGSVLPPSPKDLLGALGQVEIQPRPFGGSSGFAASRLADPSRPPLASRTVVIGTSERHSLAARYAGMRAVSLDDHDDLADAVLSSEEAQDLWLEDLATPGSFWLNPPHPRDEHGNRVDPDRLMERLKNREPDRFLCGLPNESSSREESLREEQDDESEIRRILADLSQP
jgi:hypothetical protein